MTIRAEVLALASLGPLPSESEGDVDDLAVRQSALQAIEPPVTVEEARAPSMFRARRLLWPRLRTFFRSGAIN